MRKHVADCLSKGLTLIQVDTAEPGVKLPPQLTGVTLVSLSYNFGAPWSVELLEHGIAANLKFNGAPFACWIPWEAVRGAELQGPLEAAKMKGLRALGEAAKTIAVRVKGDRSFLTVIKGGLD